MAQLPVDVSHDCEHGDDAGPVGGAIPVRGEALSDCCSAILKEGGTPETGFTCTGCGQPCQLVKGPPTAHWTCKCGTQRRQVITRPEDVEA